MTTKDDKVLSLSDIQVESKVEALILIRKRLNMSQFQFAEAIGVHASYLNMVENYRAPLTKSLEKKINEFLTYQWKMSPTSKQSESGR